MLSCNSPSTDTELAALFAKAASGPCLRGGFCKSYPSSPYTNSPRFFKILFPATEL